MWSEKYKLNACKDCKREDVEHHGKGFCVACYGRYLYKKSPKRRKSLAKFKKSWLKRSKRKAVDKLVVKSLH